MEATVAVKVAQIGSRAIKGSQFAPWKELECLEEVRWDPIADNQVATSDTDQAPCLEKIVAALRAGAEYAEVPVNNCVLIAGSKLGVAGAERIGMPCVVLRSSLEVEGEYSIG
ncbi:unnamed protein product [Ilex paraguariensis]|uniref:Uncharacterized protein n=1 Tax=Ilex paraguariensis TaxID=185542 RepID=A0ABC8ULZ7_9AQUA